MCPLPHKARKLKLYFYFVKCMGGKNEYITALEPLNKNTYRNATKIFIFTVLLKLLNVNVTELSHFCFTCLQLAFLS